MTGGRSRDVSLGVIIAGGQVDFRLAGGPWWAAFLLAVLGLVVVGVRIVFPQDSPDKLALWREKLRRDRRRVRSRCSGAKRGKRGHRYQRGQ